MKRLALSTLVLLALLLFTQTATAATQPKSNWTALNAALAPVNVKLQTDAQLFATAFTDAAQDMQDIFFVSPLAFDTVGKSVAKLKEAEAKLQADLKAIKQDAQDGIAVLDSFAPEKCSWKFSAVEYTYFASWLETATAIQAGEGSPAISAAVYLGGLSGVDLSPLPEGGPVDLEWNRVKCTGQTPPNPHPTASPAPSPTATPRASA